MGITDNLPDSVTNLFGFGSGDAEDEEDNDENPDGDAAEESDGQSDGESPDGGEDVARDIEEQIDDVSYELQELIDRVENLENNIKTVEGTQDDMSEEMDDVNDRIRNLLSIYDEVVESENPFQGNDDAEVNTTPASKTDSEADSDPTDESDDDGALTVDDLRKDAGLDNEEDSDSDEDDENSKTTADGRFEGVMDDETFLTKPPLTYAGEVVAYEWLAFLIGQSGTAGAIKAMDYYENLGWVSPEVRGYAITLLSAPAIEVTDTTESTVALSSETHKQSFRYIMKMSSVNREYIKELRALEDDDTPY
jgi:Putative archaeal flagellar protein D/E